ncbi:MAG TPA: sigma-70 family RNA polymerase sigma factor [Planctomycetota bacterium]|nr:sigma-70 family RNA polymerase sigma factor [Planctomycetota bacterium]
MTDDPVPVAEASDADLMGRYRLAPSDAIFAELVRRHAGLVHGVCLRVLGDPQGADDATQATFLVLLRRLEGLGRDTVLPAWLFRVAGYAARDVRREQARRRRREREAAMTRAVDDAAADGERWDLMRPHLDAALSSLPRVQREVVVLRYLQGLSRAEIAATLRCGERTIQTRLTRALERLREAFRRRGVPVSSALVLGFLGAQTAQAAPPALVATCAAGSASPVAVAAAHATGRTLVLVKLKAMALAACAALALAAPTGWWLAQRDGIVRIAVGDDLQAAVDAHPPGTTFVIATGVHRLQSVAPKARDRFIGEPGAVLDGARLLDGFVRDGAHWVVRGQTQEASAQGEMEPGRERGAFRHDCFLDSRVLRHVASRDALGPGAWFFDYAEDAIWIADDPAGREVATSVAPHAFRGLVDGVEIRGLVVERYATPAHLAAIMAGDGERVSTGWLIEDNDVRGNHFAGIRIGDRCVVRGNRVHGNGACGVNGGGEDALIEDNRIADNGFAGFGVRWGAAGAKLDGARRLRLIANEVHDNRGSGLWVDSDSAGVRCERNVVTGNAGGILVKASSEVVIAGNTAIDNGVGHDQWLFGAQITGYNARDVDIAGNRVVVGAAGGNGIAIIQDREGICADVRVRGNDITFRGSAGATGAGGPERGDRFYEAVVFDGNTYHVASGDARHWDWLGRLTWDEFRALGHEATGRIDTIVHER